MQSPHLWGLLPGSHWRVSLLRSCSQPVAMSHQARTLALGQSCRAAWQDRAVLQPRLFLPPCSPDASVRPALWSEGFFFFFFFCSFTYLYLAVLSLCCCTQAFPSSGKRGYSPVSWWVGFSSPSGFSFVAEHGLQALGSMVVAHGFSCWMACVDLPGPGVEPCPPHGQADS